jgi:hypothetical protein
VSTLSPERPWTKTMLHSLSFQYREKGTRETYSTLASSFGSKRMSPSPSLIGPAERVDLESVILAYDNRRLKLHSLCDKPKITSRKRVGQADSNRPILMNATPLGHRGLFQPHSVPNLANSGQYAPLYGGVSTRQTENIYTIGRHPARTSWHLHLSPQRPPHLQ